jgi:hypothetical protein
MLDEVLLFKLSVVDYPGSNLLSFVGFSARAL